MEQDPFTHQIIGLAMATHRELGPGLPEEFYHQALGSKLVAEGIEHFSKPRQELHYRGHLADCFEADLVFPGQLIAELKVLRGEFDSEHFTQILSYSKFWRVHNGMLLDFGKPSLVFKRVIYSSRTAEFSSTPVPPFVTNRDLAEKLIRIAGECLHDIGCGYRPTTWTGLVSAALLAEGNSLVENPTAIVPGLGTATMKCLVIDNQAAIAISALGTEVTAMDRACLQTCLRWLKLPWGICFHFGKANADMKFVVAPKIIEAPNHSQTNASENPVM